MTPLLTSAIATRRGSLLGIVTGLHIAAFLMLVAATPVVTRLPELPLIIDLLPAPAAQEPAAKPLPAARPQPVRLPSTPAPRQPAPASEATRSAVPAADAGATAPEAHPVAPAEVPVTQARFDADYLRNPAPPYPPLSRRAGEQGKVVLRVAVSALGAAEQVEIRTSSGSQRLDEAALATVRNWRFVAARRGDVAVPSSVLVPIIFKLEQ